MLIGDNEFISTDEILNRPRRDFAFEPGKQEVSIALTRSRGAFGLFGQPSLDDAPEVDGLEHIGTVVTEKGFTQKLAIASVSTPNANHIETALNNPTLHLNSNSRPNEINNVLNRRHNRLGSFGIFGDANINMTDHRFDVYRNPDTRDFRVLIQVGTQQAGAPMDNPLRFLTQDEASNLLNRPR